MGDHTAARHGDWCMPALGVPSAVCWATAEGEQKACALTGALDATLTKFTVFSQ